MKAWEADMTRNIFDGKSSHERSQPCNAFQTIKPHVHADDIRRHEVMRRPVNANSYLEVIIDPSCCMNTGKNFLNQVIPA